MSTLHSFTTVPRADGKYIGHDKFNLGFSEYEKLSSKVGHDKKIRVEKLFSIMQRKVVVHMKNIWREKREEMLPSEKGIYGGALLVP